MRVTPDLVLTGFFWLPANEAVQLPGTVTVSVGGEIRLELLGTFELGQRGWIPAHTVPRIVGRVETHDYITLERCTAQGEWSLHPGGISKSRFRVHHLFLGVGYEEHDTPLFTSLRVSVDGLDEWHSITGLKVDLHTLTHAAIVYDRPPARELWSDGDLTLSLQFAWTPPALPAVTKAAIRQSSVLVLRSNRSKPLGDYVRVVHQLVNFLSLAVDEAVSIREVVVTSSEIKDAESETSIPVYFPSLSFVEAVPKVSPMTMLFTLSALGSDTQAIFAAWFAAHERLMPAMNLFFSARAGPHKYLNSRFLWTVQALETFHRRTATGTELPQANFAQLKQTLVDAAPDEHREFVKRKLEHANEPSLPKRLRQMVAAFGQYFGDERAQKQFVQAITNTRHYFTHYDPALQDTAAHGRALLNLCYKMEALFQLHLMKEIGFSDAAIANVVGGFSTLKQKLNPPAPETDEEAPE